MEQIEELQWKEEFNVGVDYIDEAHKKLFAIIRRVLRMTCGSDYVTNKHTCLAAIKFFESYAINHFSAEEAYQRSVKYPGYGMHKALHDNLKHVTLPQLKEELEELDYSAEAVNHLMGFMAGWLTGHILVEDRAITGRAESRWAKEHRSDIIELLNHEFAQFMREFFGSEAKLVNRHYGGEKIGEAVYYNMEYKDENGELYDVIMFAEVPVSLFMAGKMLGCKCQALDRASFGAYVELSRSCAHQALKFILPERQFAFYQHRAVRDYELAERFKAGFPDVSVLWSIGEGKLGLCVEKLSGSGPEPAGS